MDPINKPKNGRIVISITRGPNKHEMAAAVCPPSREHWLLGASFQVTLPYQEFGRLMRAEFYPSLILTEMKVLDIKLEMFNLGGYFRYEEDRIEGKDLVEIAPVQIRRYSTKNRHGDMEMSYELYVSLFKASK